MTYPSIDPVAFTVFDWPIHWYGLAYVAAFFIGMSYLKFAFKQRPVAGFHPEKLDDIFTWIILGVILGGRLGYVLFYNPSFYVAHPEYILQMWHGGMSFHGGLIGVLTACGIFCQRHNLNFFDLMDRLAPATCIGLLLGRIANFINGELYGNITTSPLGMVFPSGGDLPRHPSQLYEATLEGLVLFMILHLLLFKGKQPQRKFVSGAFLVGYGSFRFFVEFFRARDAHLTEGLFAIISMGQILCIPMIMFGLFLIHRARKGI